MSGSQNVSDITCYEIKVHLLVNLRTVEKACEVRLLKLR